MSNPLGEQDLVGNLVNAGDLLNSATKSNPAAAGSNLPGTYVAGSVTLSGAVSSNVFATPYAEGLVLLVSLTSGGCSGIALNTGATATALVQAGALTNVSDTTLHSIFVSMPSAAIGSTTPPPGAPTAPYFSVSFAGAACQINQLAVVAVGKLATGADWPSVRGGGINAVASGVVNSSDQLNPPTNLVGSGAFSISA